MCVSMSISFGLVYYVFSFYRKFQSILFEDKRVSILRNSQIDWKYEYVIREFSLRLDYWKEGVSKSLILCRNPALLQTYVTYNK